MDRTKKSLIFGKNVVLRDGNVLSPGFLVIEDGVIQLISETKPQLAFDEVFESHWVAPGFVDIHNHGIGGAADVGEYWLTEYTTKNLPKYGTTSCLATITFPASETEHTSRVVKHLQERCGKVLQNQTVIEGIHAEGPIIQTLGGMAQSNTDPTLSEFSAFLQLLLPALKVMTISPSLESKNNYQRFIALLRENVVPALGHDIQATEEDILGALRIAHQHKKRVHLTHMFNVSKFHHREVGLVNIGILSQFPNLEKYQNIVEPSVEMIGDLVHVHPLALKLALMSKDHNKIAFISDAIMEAGCEGASVIYSGRKIINTNNQVVLENTSTLAGSCTNFLEMFRNLTNVLKVPIPNAITMLTQSPATIAGLDHIGILEKGKRADILLFSQNLQLETVFINGNIAWKQI